MEREREIFKGWDKMDIYEKLNEIQRVGKEHERRIKELAERIDRIEYGKQQRYSKGESRQTAIFS